MIPLNQIKNYENEITSILDKIKELKNSKKKSFDAIDENESILKEKITNLISSTPLGSLSSDFMKLMSGQEKWDLPDNWKLYKKLVDYTQIEDIDKKKEARNDLENTIQKITKNVLDRHEVLSLVKSVYTGQNNDLIDLFYKKVPIPPLSMFDKDNPPSILLNHEMEKTRIISKFNENNQEDTKVHDKILHLQRHIRGFQRIESEIERLANRYYKNDSEAKVKAMEMIAEANKPYFPQGCSRELCRRIVAAATEIKLYDSVSHLLASGNIAIILDTILLGRGNLLNFFMDFRPAALVSDDVNNGDGNVICMGPDKIDEKCLQGRTTGLELNLKDLLKHDNPAMFFKQTDLGYSKGPQRVAIPNNETLIFTHKGGSPTMDFNCSYLGMGPIKHTYFGDDVVAEYYAVIPKDLLISYNVKAMDKIFILNFFRYLDNLRNRSTHKPAPEKIKEIYDALESLDDNQLKEFLTNLGKKMSSTAEFNFTGAYQIDLNALKSITIYDGRYVEEKIETKDLFEQLNDGNFELLNKLKKGNPEILDSKKFVEYLLSKVDSPKIREEIIELIMK